MTAIKGLSPWVFRSELKPDTCLVTPALVYKGSHLSSNLKSWGLHLAIRPSLSRWSIQCVPMTVGGRVSSTAHLKWKADEESKCSWPSPLRRDRGSGHRLPGLQEDPFCTAQTELAEGLPQKVRSRLWPQPHQLPIPFILWRVWHHLWNCLSWPCCHASGV